MTDNNNTFQDQLYEYFAGSTGTTLGPGIVNSSLVSTKSDRFQIGYQPASFGRGIDMGATIAVADTAFIDFNSKNGGTADYDTRILSLGGELGVDGRGTLATVCNNLQLIGNVTKPNPPLTLPGNINYGGGSTLYHAPTNQGRLNSVRQVVWSGNLATSPVNPSIVISLQDIDTGVPLSGQYTITISNGYSGTGASIAYYSWSITESSVGDPWNTAVGFAQGDDLSNLYATATLNTTVPLINLYNKTADPARYVISGFVYYDQGL